MSKYGEPWTHNGDDLNDEIIRTALGWIAMRGSYTDGLFERTVACVNAMANIEDPAAFMAEVRELLKECGTHLSEYAPDTMVQATDLGPAHYVCGECLQPERHTAECDYAMLRVRIQAILARLEPQGSSIE